MSASKIAESDSGAEDDILPVEKSKQGKVHSTRRKFKLPNDKQKKPRRHNTDDPARECIRIKIYSGISEDFDLELIPALKGKTLKDSLEPILEKYNITFDSHSLFLDSSNTPLPLAFETFPLSGSILHVRDHSNVDKRVKDISQKFELRNAPENPVSRTPSFGKKKEDATLKQDEKDVEKQGKKFIMDNDMNATNSSNSTVFQKRKPTGTFAGNPTILKGKIEQVLPRLLQYYSENGLENDSKANNSNQQQFYMENSWSDIVENYENLSKNVRDQQEAIWELLTTEIAYINKLQVIKKIFILCLRNIQNEGYLNEIDLTNLFSNVEEIYAVNVSFWLNSLKPVINMARHTKQLLNSLDMADGFATFDSQFEPYLKYCMEESSCTKYFKQKQSQDEYFRLYVEWCESRPECKRLKLSDLLVKPMQRLTKYPLLLKAILKKTSDEEKRKEISTMILTVQKFVSKVDSSMKVRQEKEILSKTSLKIESYWPVDPVTDEVEKLLVDNYCDFDLLRVMPGASVDQHRCLLYHGPLRLYDKQGRMDLHIFLFTDIILLTKGKKTEKFKIVKPPMRVDKVRIHPLKDPGMFLMVYLNEYYIMVTAYVLQAPSSDALTKWTEKIEKAKALFQAVLHNDGSRVLTSDDADLQSTPIQSPKHKRNSTKNSPDFLEVKNPSSSLGSPRLRRHLSGSEGNLSLAGLSEKSSSLSRRSSCNEHKTRNRPEVINRRERSDSKIMRSTSDPHKTPRDDVLHSGRLSRSSSAKQPNTYTGEKNLFKETSFDVNSRPTTAISEFELLESVDTDQIHMSLSSEGENLSEVTPSDVTNDVKAKQKVLRGQKLSEATGDNSVKGNTRRMARSHGERKRVPRNSSLDRSKKLSERKLSMDAGNSESTVMTSDMKEGHKSKITRSFSGNRLLPDPNNLSNKPRNLPKTDENVFVDGAQYNEDLSLDGAESSRSSHQAPPIKAPLITNLPVSRNGSNGADVSRKRAQLPKRSPVLPKKSSDVLRKSMDDQLLEPRSSPPLRRARSEADTPVDALMSKSRHASIIDNVMPDDCSNDLQNIPNESMNSESASEKVLMRSRRQLMDSDQSKIMSGELKRNRSGLYCEDDSLNENCISQQDTTRTNSKDNHRKQIKKHRDRDMKKLAEKELNEKKHDERRDSSEYV
ncbi:pleckstrin homology domain-containing family G member 5-like isoform X2 [Xenia sp. Carnegie-2017]|nr:pleckstrin homology domain-containing family G member 5-like isoform X2 [Xenia sp. Carnegie-2017]